ncbi:MAG: outer membrane lipoprotein carrier protein LolA [Marinosulfonomonas sp.]|nr:outer membrane lipoprotein carrier protein LolA [Marinosulfonomonas sp.]
MNNFKIIAVVAALCISAAPVAAEKLSLSKISTYMNGLATARAEFTQISDDGTIATGQLFIRRPGGIRFEYNPPEESLVMAGQGRVAVFDAKSNQPPQMFPLKRTPLNLILAKNVDLTRAKMVVAHSEEGPTTVVTAQDPEHPDYGQIKMVFTGNPVELRQWVVIDGTGQTTTVVLGQLEKDVPLGQRLFNIAAEVEDRGL